MIRPDRAVALCLLAVSVAYGVLAWQYPLLPFEERTTFKPNTMPLGVAAIAVLLSFAAAVFPGGKSGLSSDADGWRDFDWRAAGGVAAMMLLYAAAIRPLGYLASTSLFLIVSAAVLGERRFYILIPIALSAAFLTWYLVQEVLGVFLRPWPAFWIQ